MPQCHRKGGLIAGPRGGPFRGLSTDESFFLHCFQIVTPEIKMGRVQDANSIADQEAAVNTSLYDWEDVTRRLDAIALEKSRIFQEYDELDGKLDTYILEQERIDQEQCTLREELDGIYALSPTDSNEDVDTSTNDREDDIWRKLDAIDLEISRLNQDQDDVIRRSKALSLERSRLDEEEDELKSKWENAIARSRLDDEYNEDEDVESSTDEEDSSGELDDDMFLALSHRASGLCSICRNFPRGRIVVTDSKTASRPYHLSLSSLKKSVDSDCHLCAGVAESLENFCKNTDPPKTKKEFWSIRYGIDWCHRWRSLTLWFYLCECEIVHPDGASCEHVQPLGGRQFLPARKLGLGPEFSGAETDPDFVSELLFRLKHVRQIPQSKYPAQNLRQAWL